MAVTSERTDMYGMDEFVAAVDAAYADTIDIDSCPRELRNVLTRKVGFLIGDITQLSWEARTNPKKWS